MRRAAGPEAQERDNRGSRSQKRSLPNGVRPLKNVAPPQDVLLKMYTDFPHAQI